MVDKIFGTDFTNSTDPLSTWTTSINDGSVLKDVALGDLHKALQVPAKYITSASVPTVNDDTADGYKIGDIWITTGGQAFIAGSVAAAAANWIPIPEFTDYQISVTVTSNNITVAIKDRNGNNPTSTSPLRVKIGSTVRAITGTLSVTKNAGTNWFNSGAAETATLEMDYFVYLGYNATDGVVIGFARIENGLAYSDFNTTSTNERYCAISTITNAAATDPYQVFGRFAATLSATAAFNWSVPTFTSINLIHREVHDTRWMNWTPTFTGFSANPTDNLSRFKFANGSFKWIHMSATNGTSNATTFTFTIPFTPKNVTNDNRQTVIAFVDNGAGSTSFGRVTYSNATGNVATCRTNAGSGAWTAGSTGKRVANMTPAECEY